jgi:hypothetical protein
MKLVVLLMATIASLAKDTARKQTVRAEKTNKSLIRSSYIALIPVSN